MQWAIGVDLGGTKVLVGQISQQGELLKQIKFATKESSTPEELINRLTSAISELRASMPTDPIGVGIGMAGQIEASTGLVLSAPNLGWSHFPLAASLSAKVNLDVVVDNDVRTATRAEWLLGAGQGLNDIVCLFVGTGIGGGIVSGGQLLVGASNTAGELGHMTVDIDGPRCRCGNIGCLEAFAGGWAIGHHAQEMARNDISSCKALLELASGEIEAITARHVIQAAASGDALSGSIVETALQAIIAGSVSCVNAFNPARLIFGGGLASGLPKLVERVRVGIDERALPGARTMVEVVPAMLGNNAGVIGAGISMWSA